MSVEGGAQATPRIEITVLPMPKGARSVGLDEPGMTLVVPHRAPGRVPTCGLITLTLPEAEALRESLNKAFEAFALGAQYGVEW